VTFVSLAVCPVANSEAENNVAVAFDRAATVALTVEGVVSLAVGPEVSLNVIEVIFGCWLLDSSPAKVTFVPLVV